MAAKEENSVIAWEALPLAGRVGDCERDASGSRQGQPWPSPKGDTAHLVALPMFIQPSVPPCAAHERRGRSSRGEDGGYEAAARRARQHEGEGSRPCNEGHPTGAQPGESHGHERWLEDHSGRRGQEARA